MRLRQHYFFKLLPHRLRNLPDDLILTILASRRGLCLVLLLNILLLRGIRDEFFRQFDALARNPPQLFGLALVILAEIMYLFDECLKLLPLWFLAGVVGKDEYLVLESSIKMALQHEYFEVSKVQSGLFLNRSSLASIILYKTLSFTSFSCFL